jgi:hypothetical protein
MRCRTACSAFGWIVASSQGSGFYKVPHPEDARFLPGAGNEVIPAAICLFALMTGGMSESRQQQLFDGNAVA